MTKDGQMRLCLILAFQSMISQGENAKSKEAAQRIVALARLMDEFCDLHLKQTFPEKTIELAEDKWATKIDAALNMHVEELQKREQTQLPENRETLIQFYDRLQQRKVRREQWLFYAEASTEQLADMVLKYLDEEIEDRKAGGCQ
ncbi:MAG: hypothetical protein PHD48_00805 [Alphaproteobacteria bacterium]|nr:hypothetical protein [Alphaproteobacteria bacterium]